MLNYHASPFLKEVLGEKSLEQSFASYENSHEIFRKILAISNSSECLTLLKEFYYLLELYSDLKREPLAIFSAMIGSKFYSEGWHHEALRWYERAIQKDDRRLIFFNNKAVTLFSLGEFDKVVSLAGYVRSKKSHLLDYSEELIKNLFDISLGAALRNNNLNQIQECRHYLAEISGDVDNQHSVVDISKLDSAHGKAAIQKIFLYACCFNEARLLPFFLDYYKNFVGVTEFFIFDGGSTDGSLEILNSYNANIITEQHETLNDLVLMNFRNNFWKQHRNECDWVIVCDIDEFLYHPNIKERLSEISREGVTLPKVEGYGMVSLDLPDFSPGNYLPNLCGKGNKESHSFNKNLIFNPEIDINYELGCHHCSPAGRVIYSSEYEFKNLHYDSPSYAQVILESSMMKNRLSDWNKQVKAGVHYEQRSQIKLVDYLNSYQNAQQVI